MGGSEALRDLQSVIGSLRHGDRSLCQSLAQGLALQQLGDNVRSAAFEADVVDSQNVGMVQGGGSAGFLLESAQMVRIVAGCRPDQLQGNIAAQPLIARAKNFSHPSCADFFEDPVMPDQLANHIR